MCLKLWGKFYKGQRIQIFCDNESVCYCLNTGKSQHGILQSYLREVAFLAAIHEFQIRAVHFSSGSNRIADTLSRWKIDQCHRDQFFELTKGCVLEEYVVSAGMFDFENSWWNILLFSDSQMLSLLKDLNISRRSAYAVGTVKNLKTQWESYLSFCLYFGLGYLPADTNIPSLYAQFLSRTFKSTQSIKKLYKWDKNNALYFRIFNR